MKCKLICVQLPRLGLKNDRETEQQLQDFSDKHGYSFIRRDRACGRRGGGVAICYEPARSQMSRIKLPPTKNEIIAAIGRRVGQRRKIAVIAVYLPPAMRADQIRRCLKDTNDSILHIKHKYADPYILLAGDFNKKLSVQLWLIILRSRQ